MGENVLYTIQFVGLIVLIAYLALLYQKKRKWLLPGTDTPRTLMMSGARAPVHLACHLGHL